MPLGRLSFVVYLTHVHCITLHYMYLSRVPLYYTKFNLVMTCSAVTTITFISAFFLSIFIEIPFINLDRNFLNIAVSSKISINSSLLHICFFKHYNVCINRSYRSTNRFEWWARARRPEERNMKMKMSFYNLKFHAFYVGRSIFAYMLRAEYVVWLRSNCGCINLNYLLYADLT